MQLDVAVFESASCEFFSCFLLRMARDARAGSTKVFSSHLLRPVADSDTDRFIHPDAFSRATTQKAAASRCTGPTWGVREAKVDPSQSTVPACVQHQLQFCPALCSTVHSLKPSLEWKPPASDAGVALGELAGKAYHVIRTASQAHVSHQPS